MNTCLIVGAGNMELEQLRVEKNDLLIAADGGYLALYEKGIVPDYLIGDMDSLANEALLQQAQYDDIRIKKLPVMKDDTDMLAAIKYGLELGYKRFSLFGALGGRLDHTIANLQCLKYLLEHDAQGTIYENHTRTFLVQNGKVDFPADLSGIISVFALEACACEVTETGLKYEIEQVTLSNSFPVGISNEFTGKKSAIEVKNGILLIHIILDHIL